MKNICLSLAIYVLICPIEILGQPTWNSQISPILEDLVSVSFPDTSYGWAISSTGTLIHTVNGGKQWKIQTSFQDFFPEKILFSDTITGWMVGSKTQQLDSSYILKTENGGANWKISNSLASSKLFDIFFTDDTYGWAVGFIGDTLGLRLHTTDGGDNWALADYGIHVLSIYSSVHFRDTLVGDLCGPGPVLMHTGDGGRKAPGWALDIKKLDKPMYDMVNVGDVYGCMVGADGKIIFTKDKWANFLEYELDSGDTLWSVDDTEPLGFWAVGENGTIFFVGYNEFLGLAVQDQSIAVTSDLFEVDALDNSHVWAVGENGTILHYGFDTSLSTPTQPEEEFYVFPNPATDQVYVNRKNIAAVQLKLYSIHGLLMKEISCPAGQSKLYFNLNGLNPGIYILQAGPDERTLLIKK